MVPGGSLFGSGAPSFTAAANSNMFAKKTDNKSGDEDECDDAADLEKEDFG